MNSADPSTDVVIAGASLAGATLASQLAGRGFRVLLLDRATFPRKKVCGEGLMPAGVDLLKRLGLSDCVDARGSVPFEGVRFHTQWDKPLSLRFSERKPNAKGRVLRREELDQIFFNLAKSLDEVDVRECYRVRNFVADNRGVSVEASFRGTDGREVRECFRARAIVGADGIRSQVRRGAGISVQPQKFRRHAVRGLFRNVRDLDCSFVEVFSGEGAEAYVAPVARTVARVTLLCGHGLDRRRPFRERLRRFPRLEAILRHAELDSVDATSPISLRAERYHAQRLLLVGDAAGAVDPVTGQGMTIALRDAFLASEKLSDGLANNQLSTYRLASYTRARNRYFQPAYRLADDLLTVLRFPWIGRRVLETLERRPEFRTKLLSSAVDPVPCPLSLWDRFQMVTGL